MTSSFLMPNAPLSSYGLRCLLQGSSSNGDDQYAQSPQWTDHLSCENSLTNFTEANLSRADLIEACFLSTVLGNTDLTNAQGLDFCEHWGPSVIDHRTLVKSGRRPLAFLRGCGRPETLIDHLPSLLNERICSATHASSVILTRMKRSPHGSTMSSKAKVSDAGTHRKISRVGKSSMNRSRRQSGGMTNC
jgi:hypothetical protein